MAASPVDGEAVLVQITDPHIVEAGAWSMGVVDTDTFLRTAVATIIGLDLPADAVIVTGDLVNDARRAQYDHLRTLLAPVPCPVYLLPGNHDARGPLREAFPDHPELGTGPTCDFAVPVGSELRVIALDTLVEGQPGGALAERQLAWLDDRLTEEPDRPTLLALHHPPFRTGIGPMDEQGMDPSSAAGLEAVVRRHPHVERVTCGHLHRAISRRWAGTVVATAPSVCHAVALDLRPDGVPAWNYEPPAITVHHWHPAGGLVTHQVASGNYPVRRF